MDLIIIIIFALTIFLCMRKGFVFIVAFFLKGIASIVAAYFLSGPLAGIIEGTEAGEITRSRIADLLGERLEDSGMYLTLPAMFREDAEKMSADFVETASGAINHAAWVIMSFILIVVVIRIVLGILVRSTRKSKEKEGFTGTLDWFLGLILGILMGVIFVYLFLALLFPVASLIAPDKCDMIMGWFDGSIFAQSLYDNNLLLLILSDMFG